MDRIPLFWLLSMAILSTLNTFEPCSGTIVKKGQLSLNSYIRFLGKQESRSYLLDC